MSRAPAIPATSYTTAGPKPTSELAMRGSQPSLPSQKLAYVINLFPSLTETFIYREIEALRLRGREINIFSIRRPRRDAVSPEAHRFFLETHYILPVSPLRLLGDHLRAMVRFPVRYWQVLFELLTGTHTRFRDRLRTLCHFAEAVTLLSDVERLGVDQLHAHWAVGAATCTLALSRFLGIPFSFTAHAYDIWREQLLLPEKLKAAKVIVACTASNRQHLLEAYGADAAKVCVVHHGVSLDRFRPGPRPNNLEPVILSVGRLTEQKGFDRLLRACASLAANGDSFECRIVGDGPLRATLEQLAVDLDIAPRVHFLGRLYQDELIACYATADVFALLCVPAHDGDRDGIPNTLIEAMAMELPCVSTRFSGVPELVVDGETGLLVNPDDHEGTVTALGVFLRDPDCRRRAGHAGRRRVADGFTIEASAANLDVALTGPSSDASACAAA